MALHQVITMKEVFVGIDLGTSSCKVVAIDENLKIVESGSENYGLLTGENGKAEQNPDEWMEAIIKVLGKMNLIEKYAVVGIGLTGQWSGTVPVDESGKRLYNAIIWMDTRGKKEIEEITGGFPSISGYRIDKLIKWIRKTGGAPAHSGKDSLAHILYIKKRMPDIYNKTYKFLEPKDYVAMKMTGEFMASWDNTLLLWATDNRNPGKVVYDDELINMNGLDAEKLPLIVSSDTVVGNLKKEIAAEMKLPENVPVVSGCGDIQCSLIGSGAVEDYVTELYIGTSSWITLHVPFKKTDIFNNIATLPSALKGKYFVAAEQENAGSCLDYVMNIMNISDYSLIEKFVSETVKCSNGLIFLPWLFGERAPVENPYIRGGFYNLSLIHKKGSILRSVLEGVAYNTRWLMDAVTNLVGKSNIPKEIIFSGGGAKSKLWAKIISEVLKKDILISDNPQYVTARGSAIMAGIGTGGIKIEDVKNLKNNFERIMYENTDGIYDRCYEEFLKYYRSNYKNMVEFNSQSIID